MTITDLVGGFSLVAVVFAIVSFLKTMKVAGRWLTASSLVVGLALGMLFKMSQVMPTTLAGWLEAVVYGLVLGLIACGAYDQAKEWITGKTR